MLEPGNNDELPPIPGKRYFTIGEVSDLCAVKPHVLRYWEQEFPQLKPVKRRGNRRYYQRQDVLIIRQIRSLLYDDGFTIGGARQRLMGDQAKSDVSQSQQIIKQLRVELEQVLKILLPVTQYLCAVKPHVLRYWEQEFPQLKPVKRRGNRRYYQRQDVLIIRQIRSLLYDDGFTIGGARQRLMGDQAKSDVSQSQQIIKQLRVELEQVLKILRR